MYEITLKIDGKNQTFKRTDEPFLKDITQVLILTQHQTKMYDKKDGPTDQDYRKNSDEVAQFAVNFWNKQFNKEDVLNGANKKAMAVISKVADDCLGSSDEDNGNGANLKKLPNSQSKSQ